MIAIGRPPLVPSPLTATVLSWPSLIINTSLFLGYFFFFSKFIYLFLAVLGLPCCARAFSSCSERGLLFVVVHGLLMAVASLVVEHGL